MKRTAMPVQIPEEYKRKMKEQGLYVIENIIDKMPNVGKREATQILKDLVDSGASEFLESLDPKSFITLPAIDQPNPNNVVEIDGANYYIVDVEPPKVVGRGVKKDSQGNEYRKGEEYPG
jgi:hypothetical protein